MDALKVNDSTSSHFNTLRLECELLANLFLVIVPFHWWQPSQTVNILNESQRRPAWKRLVIIMAVQLKNLCNLSDHFWPHVIRIVDGVCRCEKFTTTATSSTNTVSGISTKFSLNTTYARTRRASMKIDIPSVKDFTVGRGSSCSWKTTKRPDPLWSKMKMIHWT